MDTCIGVIGGSGLYEIAGLEAAEWVSVETPWGAPSDQVLTGRLDGVAMAFLPRHGRGHVHSPSSVPYRANIDALKRLGATDVISVSACGSFRDDDGAGRFRHRRPVHRPHRRPREQLFRRRLRGPCQHGAPDLPAPVGGLHRGGARRRHHVHEAGTYLAMEGPQFSSWPNRACIARRGAPTSSA